jgi:hypothetical protein
MKINLIDLKCDNNMEFNNKNDFINYVDVNEKDLTLEHNDYEPIKTLEQAIETCLHWEYKIIIGD